jgi:hypothetical protein
MLPLVEVLGDVAVEKEEQQGDQQQDLHPHLADIKLYSLLSGIQHINLNGDMKNIYSELLTKWISNSEMYCCDCVSQ